MDPTPSPPSFTGATVNIPSGELVNNFSDGSTNPLPVNMDLFYSTSSYNDFINKVNVTPDEISFSVLLRDTTSPFKTIKCRAIIDSGAGKSYFVCSPCYSCPLPEHPLPPVTVSLADGHTLSCTSKFKVSASVHDINNLLFDVGTFELIKLPSVNITEDPYLLLGREAMNLLQIRLHGSSEAYIGDRCIYLCDPFVDESAELADTAYLIQATLLQSSPDEAFSVNAEHLQFDMPPLPTNPSQDSISISLDDNELAKVIPIFEGLISTGWVPVYGCPQFSTRLRKLSNTDQKDNPGQIYTFELRTPEIRTSAQNYRRYYATKLFDRLSDHDKKDYQALVNSYVDQKLWSTCSDHDPHCSMVLPPVNVFMRPATPSRKARLVMDFQYLNSLWPKTTSDVPNMWCIINSLRIFGERVLGCIDLRQAFYVIRMFNVHFHLVTGVGHFLSDRMCFGTSVGPGQLDQSLTLIFKRLWDHLLTCLMCRFVDDVGINGTTQSVANNLRLLIGTLRLCGFEVQTKKFTITALSAAAEDLLRFFKALKLPDLLSPAVKILGVSLSYTADQMRLSCGRAGRIAEAQKLILAGRVTPFGKKTIFAICGLVGFDPARLHPDTRCFADALRSIVGSVYSKSSWDEKLDLKLLSPDQSVAFKDLLNWMGDLKLDCDHTSTLYGEPPTRKFQLFTDASTSGGGYILRCNDFTVISEGFLWKGPQLRYHINRLELLTLIRAIQPTADLIEYISENSNRSVPTTLEVFCDNKATVAWVRDTEIENLKKLPSIRRAMDRKALLSIAASVTDEFEALRQLGVRVSLAHVSGVDNIADGVSRLFDKKCSNNKTLACILNKISTPAVIEDADAPKAARADSEAESSVIDFVRRARVVSSSATGIVPSSLADQWSRHCWSPDQVYGLARGTRFILTVLKSNAAKVPLPTVYPDIQHSDLLATVRSTQVFDGLYSPCFTNLTHRKKVCVGPLFFSPEKQLILFKSGLPTGVVTWQYYLPKSGTAFRALLLRHAHRQVLHAGCNQTLAVVNSWGFHLPAGLMSARTITSNCYPCKVNNTYRNFSGEMGSGSDLAELVQQEPYHSVAADFIRMGEKTSVLAVTCRMSKHTTWLLAKTENTKEAVDLLHQVQVEQGGLRHIHVDRAAYFRSDDFSSRCLSTLGAVVTFVPTGAPWESLVEKLYDLGQKRLRMAIRYLQGHISKLDDLEIQRLLNYVCLLLNTRPIGKFSSSPESSTTEAITPDMLRYGYTRKLGAFSSSLTDTKLNLTSSLREVRSTFLELFWQEIRAKSAKAMALKGGRRARAPLISGQAVLVYRAAKTKLGHSFVLAHVSQVLSETHVKVVFSSGKVSTENVNSVNPVDIECTAERLTSSCSMVGALVSVMFTMTDGSERWFDGRIIRVNFDDSVLVKWLNGDKATSINLWSPTIRWKYCDVSSSSKETSEGPC